MQQRDQGAGEVDDVHERPRGAWSAAGAEIVDKEWTSDRAWPGGVEIDMSRAGQQGLIGRRWRGTAGSRTASTSRDGRSVVVPVPSHAEVVHGG